MRGQYGFQIIAVAFLSLMFVAMQPTSAIAAGAACSDPSSPYYNLNSDVTKNTEALLQKKAVVATATVNAQPVASASAQITSNCFQSAFSSLSGMSGSAGGLSSALNSALTSAYSSILNNLSSSACSSASTAVSTVTSSISNIAKICVALPTYSLDALSLDAINGCSGGTVISLSSSTNGGQAATSSYQQFFSK